MDENLSILGFMNLNLVLSGRKSVLSMSVSGTFVIGAVELGILLNSVIGMMLRPRLIIFMVRSYVLVLLGSLILMKTQRIVSHMILLSGMVLVVVDGAIRSKFERWGSIVDESLYSL